MPRRPDGFIRDRQPGVCAAPSGCASSSPSHAFAGAGRDHSGRTRPPGGGWRELEVSGKKANRFVGQPDGSIEVISSSSVSRLYRPLQVDLKATPELAWQWRVDEPVPPTDLTRKGEDDTALTIYVGFPWDPERASFTERLKRPLVEAHRGRGRAGPRARLRVRRQAAAGRGGGEPASRLRRLHARAAAGRQPDRRVVRGAGRPREGLPAGSSARTRRTRRSSPSRPTPTTPARAAAASSRGSRSSGVTRRRRRPTSAGLRIGMPQELASIGGRRDVSSIRNNETVIA